MSMSEPHQIAEGEGLTHKQWLKLPKYAQEMVIGMHRRLRDAEATAARLVDEQDKSTIYTTLHHTSREVKVYVPDDRVVITDMGGERVGCLRWDAKHMALEVMGQGCGSEALLIQPRVSNVVEVHFGGAEAML